MSEPVNRSHAGTPSQIHSRIHSMTGFASLEKEAAGQRYRIEARSVNARFLDVKFRLPKDLQGSEGSIRAWVSTRLSRGTVDLKVERCSDPNETAGSPSTLPPLPLTFQEAQARQLKLALEDLRDRLGLSHQSITLQDLLEFREAFVTRAATEATPEDLLKSLEPLVLQVLTDLQAMREQEGRRLADVLLKGVQDLEAIVLRVRERRSEWTERNLVKTRERVQGIFESFPLPPGLAPAQSVLEARIAQELALILDRTDIAEEIDRALGHFAHFRTTLEQGGPVGKKLEFLLQEMHREVNTLGNKAQDLGISEDIVTAKVRLEQLREQILNLE